MCILRLFEITMIPAFLVQLFLKDGWVLNVNFINLNHKEFSDLDNIDHWEEKK